MFVDASFLFVNKDDFHGVDGYEISLLFTLRIFFGVSSHITFLHQSHSFLSYPYSTFLYVCVILIDILVN